MGEEIGVCPRVAKDRVVACAAVERVISGAADQQIVTRETDHLVVGAEAFALVVACGLVYPKDDVTQLLGGQRDIRKIDKVQEAIIVGAERICIGDAVSVRECDQQIIRFVPDRGDPSDRGIGPHPVGEDDAIDCTVIEDVVLDDHILTIACREQIGIAAILAL